ncbi:hypothetical protein BASA60_011416 [Batrachochytrium salamandrivorans]|nr:hypothetical protein BASA60_011416 [Batrachochytrium salamandrivorans]KAH6577828.1 hypothetical protein BASA62_000671 [Batrachochytrium salamandrivorans]
MKSEYSDFLKDLGQSDDSYIEDLDTHIEEVEMYKLRLSDYFSRIKKMLEIYIENSKQGSTSKFSSTLRFRRRPGIENKPSDDEASGGAQPKSEASGSAPLNDVDVVDLMTF